MMAEIPTATRLTVRTLDRAVKVLADQVETGARPLVLPLRVQELLMETPLADQVKEMMERGRLVEAVPLKVVGRRTGVSR